MKLGESVKKPQFIPIKLQFPLKTVQNTVKDQQTIKK